MPYGLMIETISDQARLYMLLLQLGRRKVSSVFCEQRAGELVILGAQVTDKRIVSWKFIPSVLFIPDPYQEDMDGHDVR